MKYKLFRSPGNLDKAIRKHELVAVETGKNIDDVADALILEFRLPLQHSRTTVSNAGHELSPWFSHLTCNPAYTPFTPSKSG